MVSWRLVGVDVTAGRRVHERFECDLHVVLAYEGSEYETTADNVSLGGFYLLTDAKIPYGSQVTVRFRLPAIKETSTVQGTVRWNKADGVGVQFGSLRALEVWGLNQYFKTLRLLPSEFPDKNDG